jgi:hypothetical protein
LLCIDEHKTDLGSALHLLPFTAVNIRYKQESIGPAIRPCFEGPSAQAILETRREHADPNVLDDLPNAIDGITI